MRYETIMAMSKSLAYQIFMSEHNIWRDKFQYDCPITRPQAPPEHRGYQAQQYIRCQRLYLVKFDLGYFYRKSKSYVARSLGSCFASRSILAKRV